MSDARLRALERAAALGDPDARARHEVELLRAGYRHQYQPDEIVHYGRYSSVSKLRWGWVLAPRVKIPRARRLRPPQRFDLVSEWKSAAHGRFSPQTIRAVVPELWWRAQAPRVGQALVDEWLQISQERRAFDEGVLAEQRRIEDSAWAEIMTRLEGGPQVMRRQLVATVRRRLMGDPNFRIEDVGTRGSRSSRVVVGRATDARYEPTLAVARARSDRARRGAETRAARAELALSADAPSSRPLEARSSRPEPPRDQAASRRWGEALERLRGLVESGNGLAIGSTPQLRGVMGLPSTAAASELLAALRDCQVPSAADLFCARNGDEWLITS